MAALAGWLVVCWFGADDDPAGVEGDGADVGREVGFGTDVEAGVCAWADASHSDQAISKYPGRRSMPGNVGNWRNYRQHAEPGRHSSRSLSARRVLQNRDHAVDYRIECRFHWKYDLVVEILRP